MSVLIDTKPPAGHYRDISRCTVNKMRKGLQIRIQLGAICEGMVSVWAGGITGLEQIHYGERGGRHGEVVGREATNLRMGVGSRAPIGIPYTMG